MNTRPLCEGTTSPWRPTLCHFVACVLPLLCGLIPQALTSSSLSAQVRAHWFAEYHETATENGRSICVDILGNVLVGGWTGQQGWDEDFLILKYSPAGQLLWSRRWAGAAGRDDTIRKIATDPANNVVVTGHSWSGLPGVGTRFDIVTAKYDPDGNLLWRHRWNGAAGLDDMPRDLHVDASGNAYVCGMSIAAVPAGAALYFEQVTLKYSPTGNLLWTDRYDSLQEGGIAWSMAAAPNGDILVAAEGGYPEPNGGSHTDVVLTRLSPGGTLLWRTRFNSNRDSRSDDQVQDVTCDAFGNAIVTGSFTNGSNGSDVQTIKFDAGGNFQWVRTWEGNQRGAWGTSVTTGPTGHVYVAATVDQDLNPEMDHLTMAYDPAGNLLWSHYYDEPWTWDFNVDGWIHYAPDNTVRVALSTELDITGFDHAVLTYDPATGTLLSKDSRDDGEYGEQQWAAAFDLDGNAHFCGVTGSSTLPGPSQGTNVLVSRLVSGPRGWWNQPLAGTSMPGAPRLLPNGQLHAGSGYGLTAELLPPNTAAALVMGTQRIDHPLLGNLLLPNPDMVQWASTDAMGKAVFTGTVPSLLGTATVYCQVWGYVPGSASGFVTTQGLAADL